MFDVEDYSPILVITSPEKRCGKSQVLMVLRSLVRRPLIASNMTPAVIFRFIDARQPTLLIDEGDTFISENDELRGIVNGGCLRTTAIVARCTGEQHTPTEFSIWAPKVIAMIGAPPETVEDRSIPIRMRRMKRSDNPVKLRQDRIFDQLLGVRRRARRWADDQMESIKDADPSMPTGLHDRAQDNWRVLIRIADAAGGDWPRRARDAAQHLSGSHEDDESESVQLLDDVRTVFLEHGSDRLRSEAIVRSLVAKSDRPWSEIKRGRPLDQVLLARILKPFGIRPRKLRIGDGAPVRGYDLSDFKDSFERYLAPVATDAVVPDTSSIIRT
ncbi:MAG TPA: DUF3631 domain-containing protein [Vicinamibacterales bacterium]|nr:DUF3631 domain-containing protein [Vicinamibacterales bacterium]